MKHIYYTWFLCLSLLVGLYSCAHIKVMDSIKHQELRVAYPLDAGNRGRYMGLPPAPDCRKYMDNADAGNTAKWATCMGVGYK